MNSFSLEVIPMLISVFVFLSSNIFIFGLEIIEVSAPSVLNEVNAMKYLARYGYMQITEEKIKSGTCISKEAMTEALNESQKFYKLEETGNLDMQTVNKMQQPRCGNPDKFPDHLRKKRFVLWDDKWSKKRITFKINNTLQNEKYDVPLSAVESDFVRALKLWQQYIPIQLEIYYNQSGSDPNVLVSFEVGKHNKDHYAFEGPGGATAHAALPHPREKLYIDFDGEESWYFKNGKYTYGDGQRISFYQTATHEIGHTLGLRHSTDKNAVMYPSIGTQSDSDFRLSLDDIQGIQTLYP